MIITRNWLSEWIDIRDISTEKICETLNSIGLEVDSLESIKIPKGVVVGYVEKCDKHPDADKLSVCQVDVGDETLQIVCGAKNVKAGQYVPVAKIGAVLGDNFKIKKAKLRGVESSGMICSSEEIGLPKLNDGILELDDSIGELVVGKEMGEYKDINDDIIDIELTANRGDCLSVYGVARDLSAAFKRELKKIDRVDDQNGNLGIGRILSLNVKDRCVSSLLYRVFETNKLKKPLLLNLRLAFAGIKAKDGYDIYKNYTTHSTGVIAKLYSCDRLIDEESKKCEISLQKDKNEAEFVKILDKISYVGLDEDEEMIPNDEDKRIIFEESYIDPKFISSKGKLLDTKNDETFYHSSRGSEPDLEFGSRYFQRLIDRYSLVKWYNGVEIIDNKPEKVVVNVHVSKINALIGQEIEKSRIVSILKDLGFEIDMKDEFDLISVKVPLYRHDIQNGQDITEEIVRIIGIDNIKSSPLVYVESNNQNSAYKKYKKRLGYRKKASSVGFFEVVNYVFTDSKVLDRLKLQRVAENKDLLNPVTNELDTLRSSMVPGLIETVSRNIKYNKKSIRLFEIGSVFDKKREESLKISFIFSGEVARAALRNHGKPNIIDFYTFAQKISSIIGEFEVVKSSSNRDFLSPYESGDVVKDGKVIGFIGRVHIDIESEFDLYRTYICEIDFEKLSLEFVLAKGYSKYPSIERDFSFLVANDISYKKVKDFISEVKKDEIVDFYPIDIFKDDSLKDSVSLTIRFILQSDVKTLSEDDINDVLSPVLDRLKVEGILLR